MQEKQLKMKELLNTQMNAEENGNNSNYSLITHKQIENTPFIATGNEEDGYFLRFANYQITDKMDTIEDLEFHLKINKWTIITNLIIIIIEIDKKLTAKLNNQ